MTSTQLQQIKDKIILDLNSMQQEMIQEQQVNEHALHEAEIRINKLKYALQKVDNEDYGICAECEEEIIFSRLILLPESTHCVACKQKLGL